MNKNNNYTVIDGPIHNKYHHDIQGCIQKFRLGGGGKLKLLNIFRGFLSLSARNDIEHLEQKDSQNIYLKYMYMLIPFIIS